MTANIIGCDLFHLTPNVFFNRPIAIYPMTTSPPTPDEQQVSSAPCGDWAAYPAAWSILNRTLPDVFQIPQLSLYSDSTDSEPTMGSLGIPAADLERLRSIAIFPEDSFHLLYSVTIGYLTQADISEQSISVMLDRLAQLSGQAGMSRASISPETVSDAGIYSDTRLTLFESLRAPGFCCPDLLTSQQDEASPATWGELAKITERTVIELLGFSARGLKAIKCLWELKGLALSIQKADLAGLPTESYREFHRLADAYLKLAVRFLSAASKKERDTSARDYALMKARWRATEEDKRTLRELGRREQLSRERVRQIESKLTAVLKAPETLKHLAYMWLLVDYLVASGGGARCVNEIAQWLRDALGWTTLPSDGALATLIGLSSEYQVAWAEPIRVVMPSHRCVGCPEREAALLTAVESQDQGMLSFDEALESMRAFCQSRRCRGIGRIKGFSKGHLYALRDSTAEISIDDAHLYTHRAWWLNKGTGVSVLEHILLAAGKSMHFKDVHRQFNRMMPEGRRVSPLAVHAKLQASTSFLLSGRGAFMHRDLLPVPRSLLADIGKHILSRLDADDIPYVCVNGVIFKNYQDLLRAENIFNPSALYSCLRVVGSPVLSFAEYPYVLKKDGDGLRLPIPLVLEQFLLKQNGPVSGQRITRFGLEALCVDQAQMKIYMSLIPNRLRMERSTYVHLNALAIEISHLAPIVDHLTKLEQGCQVAAASLYAQNITTCQRLGISTPMLLYSLIQHFHPGKFNISPYDVAARRPKKG